MAASISIAKISRQRAKTLGLKRYFTGIPCAENHVAERYVDSYGCLKCCVEKSLRYAARHPEKVRANRKLRTERDAADEQKKIDRRVKAREKYRALSPEEKSKVIERAARWRKQNPEKYRAYTRIYLRQRRHEKELPEPTRPEPPTCEICDRPPTGKYFSLSLDHDHQTGKFRGWLCSHCNFALGHLRDDPSLADRAAAYLRRRS